jgi:hypothetical protein
LVAKASINHSVSFMAAADQASLRKTAREIGL